MPNQTDKRGKNNKKNPLWVIGAAAAFILAKGKAILPLLKFGKLGGALISMFISIGAYAVIYPFGFAVGIVLLLLVHELGHVIAAKRKGLPVSAPVFIPFLGALINMKRHPRDAATEAYMALGGPLVGTIGAVVVYGIAALLDHPLLYSIASVGFMINLFNLLPIHPLDGGRIVTAVSRWLWVVGLIGGLVLIVYLRSFILIIIWAMFAWDLYKKFVKYRHNGEARTVSAAFTVDAQPLIEQGYFLPGPDHKRELPFETYCKIEDEQQVVRVKWDSLLFEGEVPIPGQGLIHRAYVEKVNRVEQEERLQLIVHVQVDYTVYEKDAYYDVPVASRWKFGTAYALLALFLVFMLRTAQQALAA